MAFLMNVNVIFCNHSMKKKLLINNDEIIRKKKKHEKETLHVEVTWEIHLLFLNKRKIIKALYNHVKAHFLFFIVFFPQQIAIFNQLILLSNLIYYHQVFTDWISVNVRQGKYKPSDLLHLSFFFSQ